LLDDRFHKKGRYATAFCRRVPANSTSALLSEVALSLIGSGCFSHRFCDQCGVSLALCGGSASGCSSSFPGLCEMNLSRIAVPPYRRQRITLRLRESVRRDRCLGSVFLNASSSVQHVKEVYPRLAAKRNRQLSKDFQGTHRVVPFRKGIKKGREVMITMTFRPIHADPLVPRNLDSDFDPSRRLTSVPPRRTVSTSVGY